MFDGPGNGHIFRAKNEESAKAFLAEMSMQPTPERLPRTRWGRIGFLTVAAALVALALVLI